VADVLIRLIRYDLCLAWNWNYDGDFAALLDAACRPRGLSLLQITPDNLAEVLRALTGGQVTFRAFLDRASNADARFTPLVQWAREHAAYRINPQERASRTWDKAAMHLALITAGLYTPYSIVLPSCDEQAVLPPVMSPLGERFTIKPAHGGGGAGVITEATSLSQVIAARQEYPHDRYLLHAHIVPARCDSRPAWFRVTFPKGAPPKLSGRFRIPVLVGHPHPRLRARHPGRRKRLWSGPLAPGGGIHRVYSPAAHLCGLELFSTEVALTPDGLFVVVDYVNDQIDLRLQSKTPDGVPDTIVRDVAARLAALVAGR